MNSSSGQTPPNTAVGRHFGSVAAEYDYWKQKNPYYYDELKSIARQWASGARAVLDVGCGTGAILASLTPVRGVGVDLSPQMIAIARERNAARPQLSFVASDIADFYPDQTFDAVLFFDVIEHVPDPAPALAALRRSVESGGRVVISMANPMWEPVLLLAEKLGLKMPEGPHHRISAKTLIHLAATAGLRLFARDFRLLFPKDIPVFSYVVNRILGRLPLLRRLSVIEVFVFAPD